MTTRAWFRVEWAAYVRSHGRPPAPSQYGAWWFRHESGREVTITCEYREALPVLRAAAPGRWEVLP